MIAEITTRTARISDLMACQGHHGWSDREQAERSQYRHPARLAQWDAGRMLVKGTLAALGYVTLPDCEVLSRDANGRHVRPGLFVKRKRLAIPVSISHNQQFVTVAISSDPQCSVGVDIVRPDDYPNSFLDTWFAAEERSWIKRDSNRVAIAWGIKEAIYKAVSEGEAFAPQQVRVLPGNGDQYRCRYRDLDLSNGCQVEVTDHDDALIVTVAVRRSSWSVVPTVYPSADPLVVHTIH